MSEQTYEQAIEQVLSAEMGARPEMLLLRVGMYPVMGGDEREVFLPRGLAKSPLNLAVGAALAGAYPVLDLRSVDAAALSEALMELPVDVRPMLTIITDAEERDALMAQPGLRCFAPKNPRQAAGFARTALRSEGMCVLLADKTLADMVDEVPDGDFMLAPLDEKTDWLAAEQTPEEESDNGHEPEAPTDDVDCAETADEEPAMMEVECAAHEEEEADQSEDECAVHAEDAATDGAQVDSEQPVNAVAEATPCEMGACAQAMRLAARGMPFDGTALRALAEQLTAPRGLLTRLLMERLRETECSFEYCCEMDALPGECAYLPPERESAMLWLGADQMTLTYDASRLSPGKAALLARAARRLLETPTLLIYDRERDRL